MQEKELKLTMKKHNRHEIMEKVMNKEMKLIEAAELMGICYRQAKRIKKRYEEEGVRGLMRKEGSGRKGFSESFRKSIVYLYNKYYNGSWHPFNIRHFREKLDEIHGIEISYETTRNIINKNTNKKPRQ
ncbi:MAG: helix-turn-helix domain-containing protein [candidate division WOR-3 bacterium]|nr:helix-turn-helix domain-containing protein [candidate division WOR-3 bacterium]